ncbi:hypothetical protein M9Y10_017255 [Tritrichomonas musculus]|uniref:Uncharacterized protein n=1 Tax=Tritrichomonas musculus TaxID=1915356 RepID=A0ABR2HWQ1_9EUKA
MIKKRNNTASINANISLEPSAASQSTNNLTNNIIINKRDDGKEEIVITRDVELNEEKEEKFKDVRNLILETYAQILLENDKTLITNLISKKCIIVSLNSLQEIIKNMLKCEDVIVFPDEDLGCCSAKTNPIRKIDAIKIIKENGEVVMDFKNVYNKEWNELVNVYHLCLKYCVV